MRIRKLYLKDIGPFDEVEFEFKPQEKGKAEIHILTGPNGSGKTTVLLALSHLSHVETNSEDLFQKRFRSQENSLIKISNETSESEELYEYVSTPKLKNDEDFEKAIKHGFRKQLPAFAYSGYRAIRAYEVNAIQEMPDDLSKDSLAFEKHPNSYQWTNQWIANSISKRALEKEKQNLKKANKFASALNTLEKTLSEIIGYPLEFNLNTEPLNLNVKANNTELDFDVLPDGLRSLISWLADLLKRLDLETWENDLPVNEQEIFLFLDEIEVHLHPAWQRKVLPAVQKLLPNAQIFLTTHSPFVVNSVDGAAIYELKVKDGKAYLGEVTESKSSMSYRSVLREVFDIEKPFGGETQDELDKFQQQRDQLLKGEDVSEKQFIQRARKLAKQSEELLSIISLEIKQINIIKGTNYEL